MRRREFIAGLGGTAMAAGSGRAWGQQRPNAVRRIGIVMNVAASDPEGISRVAAFHQGMERLGWSLGRNLRIRERSNISHGGDLGPGSLRGNEQRRRWIGNPTWALHHPWQEQADA